MSKELDPSLFGEGAWASPRAIDRSKSTAPEALTQMETRLADLRVQNREIREDFGKFTAEMEEFKRLCGTKFERLNQQMARLEALQGKVHQEVSTRVSHLHNKLGERQSMDLKIHEMMDKHQAMMRSADMKMAQMQRILQDREAQILQTQMALNEAKIEMARMKRL